TLVKALHHTHQSIRQALNKLGNKIQRSAETQDKTRSQQLERLMLYLFPNHHPQERVLAPVYFQIKYGWEFFNTLLQELPDDVRTHWVVEL
ncbi:MAG TPA: bacillithiol biosynthesis BshC, partial [Calditrichae bacterium]|nr:bacillithiol biosynthesis BshC [Calditrichia bacterium]